MEEIREFLKNEGWSQEEIRKYIKSLKLEEELKNGNKEKARKETLKFLFTNKKEKNIEP